MQPKDICLLIALVENHGKVVHKNDLLKRGWPDSFVEEANLTVHIANLRRALGDDSFIITIPKVGYKFTAPVSELLGGDEQAGEFEPDGGAVPLDSKFYIHRLEDDLFHAAVVRHDSILLVKGACQVGKTSLLGRGIADARQIGMATVWTDLQMFNQEVLRSPVSFCWNWPKRSPSSWETILFPTRAGERNERRIRTSVVS